MWDPLQHLYEKIKREGGFVNAHAHLDRAFSVIIDDFIKDSGNVHKNLQEKWKLLDKYKKETKEETFYKNITKVLKLQKQQTSGESKVFEEAGGGKTKQMIKDGVAVIGLIAGATMVRRFPKVNDLSTTLLSILNFHKYLVLILHFCYFEVGAAPEGLHFARELCQHS
jgi:hypothetical protein